jgi:hypothetical protein
MFACEDGRRERFQLLAAALVYSRRSLHGYGLGGLHKTPDPTETPTAWKIVSADLDTDAEILAGMDSASSSFRIVTALELAHPYLVERGALFKGLQTAASVRCRELDRVNLQDQQRRAVLAAHRDNFGHGERGDSRRRWNKHRREYFAGICHCRIIERSCRRFKAN